MIKSFYVEQRNYREVVEWCKEELDQSNYDRWGRASEYTGAGFGKRLIWHFWFVEENDALLFKLTWGIDCD